MASTQYKENSALKYNISVLCKCFFFFFCVVCSCCWSAQMTFLPLSSALLIQILSLAAAEMARCWLWLCSASLLYCICSLFCLVEVFVPYHPHTTFRTMDPVSIFHRYIWKKDDGHQLKDVQNWLKRESFFTDYLKTLIERSHLDHISSGFETVTVFIPHYVPITA